MVQEGGSQEQSDRKKCMDSKEEANFVSRFVGDGIEIEQITAEWRP